MTKKFPAFLSIMIMMLSLAFADHHAGSPFNGKDLKGWSTKKKAKGKDAWVVGVPSKSKENPKTLNASKGGGAMINKVSGHGQSWDIYSEKKWGGKFRIELEVMVPEGANSGIYVMGEYEVQVLDSYGKAKLGGGDMGAIYGAQPPKVNACKKPGEWQKYVIDFKAPGYDPTIGKTSNAKFIKVELNGQILHENVEMKGPTPSGVTGKEAAKGPIMFQGDHGPVAYRNIKIKSI
ncbi:MAG: DUF1080 domain-containing protein [Nitrospinaceae bacterium]|nr:DUF1080 domain-containing protein [Nitrospinaceae bacterium]